MEIIGWVAIILCCGLFADSMLIKARLKQLEQKVRDAEKSSSF